MERIRPFERLGKGDVFIAGGKGASLGEMTQAGIPVPPGFVILAGAFEQFLDESNLSQELDAIFHTVNNQEIRTVELASERIQSLILAAKMPDDIATEILAEHRKLNASFVAVRSSATAEDGATAAWAGQLDTYLNTTEETLLENVKRCWASLFTPRAIFYRFEKGMHGSKISVAVVIQKMVQSEVSGIAFSVHPVTEDLNQLIIEAGFGLGEAIVSGQVTPDSFVIEKEPRRIIDKNVTFQSRALWRAATEGNEWRELSEIEGNKPALSDEQALELAELVLTIESHYGFPCDIEWAYEAGHFFITQSRPITTLAVKQAPDIVTEICKIEWQQDWSGMYTQLTASLDDQPGNESYFTNFEKSFGKSLSHVLIFFDGEHATAWMPTKEYEEFGTYLAQKAQDPQFLKVWLDKIHDLHDRLLRMVTLPEEDFLQHLHEYREIYPQYAPYIIAAKTAFDFLPLVSESVGKELEAARKRTEKFYSVSHALINSLTASIAQKIGYSAQAVRAMTIDELEAYVKEGTVPPQDILNERMAMSGVYMRKGIHHALSSSDVMRISGSWRKGSAQEDLRGVTAYPGKVTGRCRVVRDFRGVTIEEGEVLVAVMTDPSFVPLMKNAVAIVTDAGGLLSHASIVARELKKPCVVGTKFATSMLKDGDMVEVDADQGIVKRI